MKFDILIDDIFYNYCLDSSLNPIDKKKILTIINDFEDGKWRFEKFQKFIWNNIKETALSVQERMSLVSEGEDSILTEAAKKLRLIDDPHDVYNGKGGEIAEILLYGIMRSHYGALPVVPKIFYKQNKQDFAKGADSVHIVIEDENNFSLWFGESKFYNSIENARLQVIVNSVNESLKLDKLKKENSIITNITDLDHFEEISPEMRVKIKSFLSQGESIDLIKPILNIPILLLHECEITSKTTEYNDAYKNEIINHHKERATKYFEKQINTCGNIHKYSEIKFHIILFPVANKKEIEDKFILKANSYK